MLLHGFPDTAHAWDSVRPALAARGFYVVSPFLRGHAPSGIPREDAYDPVGTLTSRTGPANPDKLSKALSRRERPDVVIPPLLEFLTPPK